MQGMSGPEYHALITAELLELPRHMEYEAGPDHAEFGSNFTDIGNCALLMSHTIWFPRDYVRNGVAGHRFVEPAKLRNVRRGLLPPDPRCTFCGQMEDGFHVGHPYKAQHPDSYVFCVFEITYPGRTAKDMREIFWAFHTRQLALDRRYEDEFARNRAYLIAQYLEARDAKVARDMARLNANGQESINITVG